MGVGLVILIYLAIGGLIAWQCAGAVGHGLKHEGESAELDDAMRQAEHAVGGVPGGMVTALAAITLFWPFIAIIVVRERRGRRKGES